MRKTICLILALLLLIPPAFANPMLFTPMPMASAPGQGLMSWQHANNIEVNQNGASVAKYTYDGLNRRVSKWTPAETITYVYNGDRVVEEYSNGSRTKSYAYAGYIDDPVLMEDAGGNKYYYLKDRQFNVVALTDSSGNIVESYDYSPFGLMRIFDSNGVPIAASATGNILGYQGRAWDAESGLWNYRNRMYSPQLGRFLQRDPSGYQDGINLYAFERNNPLRYLDAMGLSARQGQSFWDFLVPSAYGADGSKSNGSNYFSFGHVSKLEYTNNPLLNAGVFAVNTSVAINNDINDLANTLIVPPQRLTHGGFQEFWQAESAGAKAMGQGLSDSAKYTFTTPLDQQLQDAGKIMSTSAYWEQSTATAAEIYISAKATSAMTEPKTGPSVVYRDAGGAAWENTQASRPLSKMGHAQKHLPDFQKIAPTLTADDVAKILENTRKTGIPVATSNGGTLYEATVNISGKNVTVRVVESSGGVIKTGFPVNQ